MLVTTKDLTPGERLRVARRRDGRTQEQYATRYDVTLRVYRRWEHDSIIPRDDVPPLVPVGRLSGGEQCYLARCRAGRSVASVAEESGLSVWTISRVERNNVCYLALLDYWRGY